MAKFTKLNIGEAVAASGGRAWKRLSTESATTNISFTIEGASYTADSGMTWADWVASDYNTDGFVITNGYLEYSGYPLLNSASVSQKSTDTIVEGEAYSISWGGSN